MTNAGIPIRVSLVAVPDVMLSSLTGIYDALNCFELLGTLWDAVPSSGPFRTEIVAPTREITPTASGLPIVVHREIQEVDETDIVIVPSMMVESGAWKSGRYPMVVDWLKKMHGKGALLSSACSGVFLLAETGLLDGRQATIHWAYARAFQTIFPKVHLHVEKVLVTSGKRQELVMSGASASWHDLVLNLVVRHVGPVAAQRVAKFMLLQWHLDGQSPYLVFEPVVDHGDAVVLDAQEWLDNNYAETNPVTEMVNRSGLAERSFKRRFAKATGHPPLDYVQRVRIEEGKLRLERSDLPVDEIARSVGYENPAFFRRLFKRVTGITPGAYRRKFRVPDFARNRMART